MNIMPIPGFPTYYVTDTGLVLREMTGGRHPFGYSLVNLTKEGKRRRRGDGKQKQFPVTTHRAVLLAFRGKPKKGQVARHLNGDPADNRLANLEWGTMIDNQMDRIRHGTDHRGEKHYAAKIEERDVIDIRNRRSRGETLKSIAESYGVTEQNIHRICARKTWRCVP